MHASVQNFPFYKDTDHTGLGVHPYDLFLTNYICNNPVSIQGRILRWVLEVRILTYQFWKGHNLTHNRSYNKQPYKIGTFLWVYIFNIFPYVSLKNTLFYLLSAIVKSETCIYIFILLAILNLITDPMSLLLQNLFFYIPIYNTILHFASTFLSLS